MGPESPAEEEDTGAEDLRATQRAGPDVGLPPEASLDVCVIIVSYNTRALTLRAIGAVLEQVPASALVVVDNDSADGSANAIASSFPQVELIRSPVNIGFGRAVNLAAQGRALRWLLLLNPDAELCPGAIAALVSVAEAQPGHGVYGGRTLDMQGRTQPTSCGGRITPWSVICQALFLHKVFPERDAFDPEGLPSFGRDVAREVDVVHGCFCLIDGKIWNAIGGFDPVFWLYGEDHDLCLRATRITGRRPLFVPQAAVRHVGGAASEDDVAYRTRIAKGRTNVMYRHWPRRTHPLIRPLGLLWVGTRLLGSKMPRGKSGRQGASPTSTALWREVWRRRADWIDGY